MTRLTPRQSQIADLVRLYKSNQEIAELLNIEKHTVSWHLYKVYRHYKVKNRLELIKKFLPEAKDYVRV